MSNFKGEMCCPIIIVAVLLTAAGFIFNPNHVFAQITTSESCNCVIFRFDDIQDYFLTPGQTSVMDLFSSKNQTLVLGLIMNQFGNDTRIVDEIKKVSETGLFELAIHGWDHDNYSKLTGPEQMVSLYQANQKLYHLLGKRSNVFIPPYNEYNNDTVDSMLRLGFKTISGIENIQRPNDKFLPVVTNSTTDQLLKINNIPQTATPLDFGRGWWIPLPMEQVMRNITSSIEKYGYAVVTLHPQGYVESSNKTFTDVENSAQLYNLNKLIDQIVLKGWNITNYSGLTGTGNSQFYEPITPKPIIRDRNLKAEVVYEGLNFPTKMAFLGPNDILVLEKNEGIVKRIQNGNVTQVLNLNVSSKGERGLLGIAVADREKQSPYVFLYYTESLLEDGSDISLDDGNEKVGNLLYRYELKDNKLINPKLLLNVPPGQMWLSSHNGGAMSIGPDNNLYLTVGDQLTSGTVVQNIRNGPEATGNGGILRMSLDGKSVGSGILGDYYPLKLYYGYGIRNSFGIAFDPLTGNLWDSENGAGSYDEINLIKPGFNSGWKKVQGIVNQTEVELQYGKPFSHSLENFGGKGKYRDPELTWMNSSGLTGISFLNSSKYGSEYHSDLFIGEFHYGNLYHFDLTEDRNHLDLRSLSNGRLIFNDTEIEPNIFGKSFGGIVDVKEGPDGILYILSTNIGGGDCLNLVSNCIPYVSSVGGSIFRIMPSTDSRLDLN